MHNRAQQVQPRTQNPATFSPVAFLPVCVSPSWSEVVNPRPFRGILLIRVSKKKRNGRRETQERDSVPPCVSVITSVRGERAINYDNPAYSFRGLGALASVPVTAQALAIA